MLGDERDGPRGRIQFMQKMLEQGGTPSDEAVHHIDRCCLSCLNCRTACPSSSVDYARLVDTARAYIHEHYRRPLNERFLRWIISKVFTRPVLTRLIIVLRATWSALQAAVLPLGRLGVMREKGAAISRPRGPELLRRPESDRQAYRAAARLRAEIAVARLRSTAAASPQLSRRGIELVPLEGAGHAAARFPIIWADDGEGKRPFASKRLIIVYMK